MTDELRAKFEAWAKSVKGSPIPLDVSEYHFVTYLDDVTSIAWHAWQAAHASRDAEVEALKRDAERYRWLRDVAWSLPAIPQEELPACAVFSGSGRRCKDISGEEMDQAIDAAMAKESGE